MPDTTLEHDAFRALATTVARSRDDARNLSLPFASRLLDMCLVEIAMVWQGRESGRRSGRIDDPVNLTLETKLRIAAAEREARHYEPSR